MRVAIIYDDAPVDRMDTQIERPIMVFEVVSVYFAQELGYDKGFVCFDLLDQPFPERFGFDGSGHENQESLGSVDAISRKDFDKIKDQLLKEGYADLTSVDLFPAGFT